MTEIECPLYLAAKKFKSAPAIITASEIISFEEFNQRVNIQTKELVRLKKDSQTRVAFSATNRPDTLVFLYALWRAGIVACPLNARLPTQALQANIDDLKCRKIFDPTFDLHKTSVEETGELKLDLDRHATVLFTSGSGDIPRPCLHTLGNHYYSALGSNENIPFAEGDRWLLCLPLYHVSGLSLLFRSLLAGGAIVIPNDSREVHKAIEEFEITHASLIGTQLYRLILSAKGQNLRSLKALLLGGGPTSQYLVNESLKEEYPIFISYGLTEMASQVATSTYDDIQKGKVDSAKLLNYRELKIADDGEILVKGKTLFKGYLNNESLDQPFDTEGWFETGDIGVLDEKNHLTVTGRKDNMFISGGENIQPEEIERLILMDPSIREAIVVSKTDKEFGQRPVVFMDVDEKTFNMETLRESLVKALPKFKLPVSYYALPPKKSHELKVKRKDLILILEKSSGTDLKQFN